MKKILDTTIQKAKELSLYSDSVDWPSLETKIYESAENSKSILDLKPSFELLLNQLRDHHGVIRTTPDNAILANFTDHQNSRKNDTREFDLEIWKVVNDVESRFEYAILANKIGYLKIVGVGPNLDGQKESTRIRNALIELVDKNVGKWIIDLRYNGGGNVNVMLSGIAPLLDTTQILTIKDLNGKIVADAKIENANFTYFGNQAFEMAEDLEIDNSKIAILTSRWTVSSGEFVAVAFKGQKNTRFFGEETGGFTTNNGWEVIDNQIVLSISTGIYSDRNGIIYPDNVKPDVQVVFKIEDDLKKDDGIRIATEWLLEK